MKAYSTGEVEALLGLPASTLRFWEKEVPFLAPRKDLFGRRAYSSHDLCTLSRLKHLALARGMGLKAACRVMEEEITGGDPSLRAEFMELRTLLFSYFVDIRELRRQFTTGRQENRAQG